MQLLGTYSTNGYTIVSLSYNPTASELVATVADAAGNLVVQEISDAGTASNGILALNAQRQVGTVPFTGAVPHFSSTTQNSAVPLLVASGSHAGGAANDGWLSVSATTSGFTVTDTLGHLAFMDGQTPSAVTSVAIDPSEYVAYLAVPDSNQVITVYLPQ
jgi:hypothetical protein